MRIASAEGHNRMKTEISLNDRRVERNGAQATELVRSWTPQIKFDRRLPDKQKAHRLGWAKCLIYMVAWGPIEKPTVSRAGIGFQVFLKILGTSRGTTAQLLFSYDFSDSSH